MSLGDAGLMQEISVLPWPSGTARTACKVSLARTSSLSPHCSSAFANCAKMFSQSGSGFKVITMAYQ